MAHILVRRIEAISPQMLTKKLSFVIYGASHMRGFIIYAANLIANC